MPIAPLGRQGQGQRPWQSRPAAETLLWWTGEASSCGIPATGDWSACPLSGNVSGDGTLLGLVAAFLLQAGGLHPLHRLALGLSGAGASGGGQRAARGGHGRRCRDGAPNLPCAGAPGQPLARSESPRLTPGPKRPGYCRRMREVRGEDVGRRGDAAGFSCSANAGAARCCP